MSGATAIVLDRPGDRLARPVWTGLLTGLAAVALTAVSIPLLSALYGVFVPLAFLVAVAHGVGLVLAPRRPRLAVHLSGAAVLAVAVLTVTSSGLPWPVPVATMITQLLVITFVALRGDAAAAVTAVLVSLAAASAPLVLTLGDRDLWPVGSTTVLTFATIAVLVTAAALAVSRTVPGARPDLAPRLPSDG